MACGKIARADRRPAGAGTSPRRNASEDKWLRAGAAWGLGRLGDPRAVDRLLLLLKDTKVRVRKEAAWALGSIADERAVPGLTEALDDSGGNVSATRRGTHSLPSAPNTTMSAGTATNPSLTRTVSRVGFFWQN